MVRTWWSRTSRSCSHRKGTEDARLDLGVRRLRARAGAAARGAVHSRKRLLRHPGRGSRMRGGPRPLPGDVRGRLLQPPHLGRGRPPGRERGHGQSPQLAATSSAHRLRELAHTRHPQGSRPPPEPGPARGHAGTHPALRVRRGRCGPVPRRTAGTAGPYGRSASGRAAHGVDGSGLVRGDRGRDGARRESRQHRSGEVPPSPPDTSRTFGPAPRRRTRSGWTAGPTPPTSGSAWRRARPPTYPSGPWTHTKTRGRLSCYGSP